MNKIFVYVGRFEPMHFGHVSVVKYVRDKLMRNKEDKFLLIIGSKNKSRESRNPFSYLERREMINNVLKKTMKGYNYAIDGINDSNNNYASWIEDLKNIIQENNPDNLDPIIVGEDDIQTYAKKAKVSYHFVPLSVNIHATKVRQMILDKDKELPCPTEVKKWLKIHNAHALLTKIKEKEKLKKMSE